MAKKRKLDPKIFDKNPIDFNQKEVRTIKDVLDSFDEDQETLFYGFIGAFISERDDLCSSLIFQISLYLGSKKIRVLKDGTLVIPVNDDIYRSTKRVLIEHENEGTLYYPDEIKICPCCGEKIKED